MRTVVDEWTCGTPQVLSALRISDRQLSWWLGRSQVPRRGPVGMGYRRVLTWPDVAQLAVIAALTQGRPGVLTDIYRAAWLVRLTVEDRSDLSTSVLVICPGQCWIEGERDVAAWLDLNNAVCTLVHLGVLLDPLRDRLTAVPA